MGKPLAVRGNVSIFPAQNLPGRNRPFTAIPLRTRFAETETFMIKQILEPRAEVVYSILRIVVGLLFAFHGFQKIFGVMMPPEYLPKFGTQMWFGGVIEVAAGLLVAIGLFTHWAAFIASGTMAVAYTQFHWKFAFDGSFFPVINKGEPALLFCFVFLYIACRGGGLLSADQARGNTYASRIYQGR